MAKGRLVQAMRWILLHLEIGHRDSATPWKLTFLQDPTGLVHPAKGNSQLDLNASLLCTSQLTAIVGLSKDLELLQRRLQGQNGAEEPGGWPRKGQQGQQGGEKEKEGKGKECGKGRKGGGRGGKEGREAKEE